MATNPQTGVTYAELRAIPDDHMRRELIGGEVIVTPAPGSRHQQVVATLVLEFGLYVRLHGGRVFPAPFDVYLSDLDVVQPDVVFVRAENVDRIEGAFLRGSPDLVVEISSPSTKRVDLVRKRELYARFNIPEYWYVDLDSDEVHVDRLTDGGYSTTAFRRGTLLSSEEIAGFSLSIDTLLDPPTPPS